MSKRRRYRAAEKTLGTSPGTLTYVGEEIEHATKVKRIEYNAAEYHVDDSGRLSACRIPDAEAACVNWTDVDGIHEPKVIAALGQQYHLHPLLLEDVMNTEQKPKIDLYDSVVFVTLKMLHHNRQQQQIETEHVSLVLGKNYLISFQEERTKDIFEPVIERIKASAGKTRVNGSDYLLYALIDLMVDNYLLIIERIGDKMDELEERIVHRRADQQTLTTLYSLKRELAYIRRSILPLRDIIGTLIRGESDLIQPGTMPFLRDLADHANQSVESLDTYREIIGGLMEMYYSIVNNRMNSVMKTLTIFTAIFMPLTFIAGIYGMNFDNMPELKWEYGYFITLGVMAAVAIGLIVYFRQRGWIGGNQS